MLQCNVMSRTPQLLQQFITTPAQNTVSGRGDFVTSLISEVGKESKVTE